MKTHQPLFTLFLFFVSFYLNPGALFSQTYVNQDWIQSSGEPDSENFPLSDWDLISWSSSAIDVSGNHFICGNTLEEPSDTDVLLTKYSNVGDLLWKVTYSGVAGGYDYGTALKLDGAGNILVAGVTADSNGYYDIIVLKYSSTGSLLWSTIWDGPSGLHDVSTTIQLDDNSEIIVAGGTYSLTEQMNIAILKLDTSGTVLWSVTDDYNDLDDIATTIEINAGNKIKVSGFSSSSSNTWDYTRILYSSSGSEINENRLLIPSLTIAQVSATVTDEEGNIYIASNVLDSASYYDIQVVKIDTNFQVDWIVDLDGFGFDDEVKSIQIDTSGKVLVAGNVITPTGASKGLLCKIDSSGIELWRRYYASASSGLDAKIGKIIVSANNQIFFTGSCMNESYFIDLVFGAYDEDGNIGISRKIEIDSSQFTYGTNIILGLSNEIFITGVTKKLDNKYEYNTVKFTLFEPTRSLVFIDSVPAFIDNQLIVRFYPQFVDSSFVDNNTRRFAEIDEVIPDSIILEMETRTGLNFERVELVKTFYRLSTKHTISISRLGDTIPMPAFWSTFLMIPPAGANLDTLISALNDIEEFILYAENNYVMTMDNFPDDTHFVEGLQGCFDPTYVTEEDYEDANINLDPAWDVETGRSYVRVGVFGVPIYWGHEDFGDGTYEGSQVAGGYYYSSDGAEIYNIESPAHSHETACAGLIGAIRYNNKGIAGIAGGGSDGRGSSGDGVQLYSMGVGNAYETNSDGSSRIFDDQYIVPAIVEGAMFDPTGDPIGFGLHVMNFSISSPYETTILLDAIRFAYRNECAFVASRGNIGNDALRYPACLHDNAIINVGASGFDGERWMNFENGNTWAETDFGSSYGGDIDFLAPGITEVTPSLINPEAPSQISSYPAPFGNQNSYQAFSGTSSSAAIVSGVAALMLSEHNTLQNHQNNLSPDDIEFLLERYADDYPNYGNSGYGKINAGDILEKLEAPKWRVFHSGEPIDSDISFVTDLYSSNNLFYFKKYKQVDSYENEFPATTQIVDAWKRGSSTRGLGSFLEFAPLEYVDWDDWATFSSNISSGGNSVTVSMKTYYYELYTVSGNTYIATFPTGGVNTAYSLHLFDATATKVEEQESRSELVIFPNPSSGQFTLYDPDFNTGKTIEIKIFNLESKLLENVKIPFEGTYEIDLEKYPNGFYFCHVFDGQNINVFKLIKQ